MLREYQQRAIDQLYAWFEAGNRGNPCLSLPTGSGKSHIVAALCKDALQNWPETRILMLTHSKELLEQNAEKMRLHWPGAPMGIYSASVGKRQLGEPITFAGIQSVRNRAKEIGHTDIIIIDECHLVNHKDEGGYRKFLATMATINPDLRVVGLTASPYRLGHGLITDAPAIFDALLEPVSIEELVYNGYLAPLRSKATSSTFDVSGVHKRGGEFIESELQAAVDTDEINNRVVREVIALAGDRQSWLFFCTGIAHAEHVASVLIEQGISAECVTGETPKKERERKLADFESGKLRALCNVGILTTGFDFPGIDLIAMLRPTMSAGLYVQMAGRGMRPKSHTDHCMVLDFAGVVATHGPITHVKPPKKGKLEPGEAPTKTCESCGEMAHISAKLCPACGHPFKAEVKEIDLRLRDDDIMGLDTKKLEVASWTWRKHISRASGLEMLAVTYYGGLSDAPITEYLPVMHDGYAGQRARNLLAVMAQNAGLMLMPDDDGDYLGSRVRQLGAAKAPSEIEYRKDGNFYRVMTRSWT